MNTLIFSLDMQYNFGEGKVTLQFVIINTILTKNKGNLYPQRLSLL